MAANKKYRYKLFPTKVYAWDNNVWIVDPNLEATVDAFVESIPPGEIISVIAINDYIGVLYTEPK